MLKSIFVMALHLFDTAFGIFGKFILADIAKLHIIQSVFVVQPLAFLILIARIAGLYSL
jgi:hypothetical protein